MHPEAVAQPTVCVLLATCNGAAFLDAQLQSLRMQTDSSWVALVSDDASDDRTMEIVRRHAADDPRIVALEPFGCRQGIRANFGRLMAAALAHGAPLFALCDQDDLWHPEKIARLRDALASGPALAEGEPALAYADLRLVDARGAPLAESHFEHAGAASVKKGVGPWLLAHNLIPGCTLLGNRALLELACPIPSGVFHHDWWILLVAAAAGRVIAVDAVLTAYRQHGANAIGAHGPWQRSLRFFQAFPSQLRSARRQYALALAQADALIDLAASKPQRFRQVVWLAWAVSVRDGLGASSPLRRASAALCGPVRRLGFARNVLFAAMAILPRARRAAAPGLTDEVRETPCPHPRLNNSKEFSVTQSAPSASAAVPDCAEAFHRWYYDTGVWEGVKFLGVPCLKSVMDLWNYQEILYELKPGLIVEFGTRHGGSALYFSLIAQQVCPGAKVLTVDIEDHLLDPRVLQTPGIEFMKCSSIDPRVAARIAALREQLPGPVFAILDSDHRKQHVLQEMLSLRELLRAGDYLIVEDSNINGHPVLPGWGEGPNEAISAYFARFPHDYVKDARRENKFGFTFAPDGFLQRL